MSSSNRRSIRVPAFLTASVIAVLLAVAACSTMGCSLKRSNVLRISGSTTLLPLVLEGADRYMKANGGTVLVMGGGSSVGISQVKQGIVDMANSSRDLKQDEDDGTLAGHPIALDVIAIITHSGVSIDSLSSDQVKAIFTGEATNWSEVGGQDAPIMVVVRDRASGTREMFDSKALDKEDSADSAIECNSNGIVRETVAATPNSIGYLSVGYVNDQVRAVKYDGVWPGLESAKDQSYPLSRFLYVFTLGEPEGKSADFLSYLLSEEFQYEVVAQEYIPVIDLEE